MNCKSYIPGYYTTRGLNKDRGNSWPIYYDNKLLNGHLQNSCMFNSLNGYSEYDKDMLKRTMLEHEAIFKKQVYELHRLYRIQKDLMEEIQKNGLYRFSTWTVKSKSSLSSSEAQSQVTGRIWQMYNQPSLSSSQSRETTTVTNTNVSPISTLRSSIGALEIGVPGRDGESNARFRASAKRMLDLQVPADAYIDADVTERSEKEEIAGFSSSTTAPYFRKCSGDPEDEVKLTLANVSNGNGGSHTYDSCRKKNGLLHCLADLNEPMEDALLVGTAYSSSSRHLCLETQLDENHRPNGSLRSTDLWLLMSSSKNLNCDGSGSLLEAKKKASQVCSQYLGDAGTSKFDLSLDSGKEKCKTDDFHLKELNKAEILFVQKKDNSLEIPRKSSNSALSNDHDKLASLNINAAASRPLLPAWMKPSVREEQSSSQLQTISSFEQSTTMNNSRIYDTTAEDQSGVCDRLQSCSDLSHLENEKFFHQNRFNHRFHLNSCSYNNLNLNSRESCAFDVRDGVTAPKINATSEIDSDCKDLSPELPLVEINPKCDESLNLNKSSGVDLCFSTSVENEGLVEIKTVTPSCNLEKSQGNEIPNDSCQEKIIGLPSFKNFQPDLNLSSETRQKLHELQHCSLFSNINSLDSEKQFSGENSRSLMDHIDLNCDIPVIEEPILSKMSTKSSVCVPSQTSDTSSSSGAFPSIELEENNTPEIESTPCRIRIDSQQNGCSHDMLIREAAENMIALSIDKFERLEEDQRCSATEPPSNSLHWFANVALSDTRMKNSEAEMDLFELMTLHLEEMKPEEAWRSSRETENSEDYEKNRALLLFKNPRKGQARKRRQRRDFQKDTLPGLATLSRKEMVEDLQLIGGLMKASGCHWQVSTGRRNVSRNGMLAKAKRRQLSRKTTIADTLEHSRPQKTLSLFSKNANDSDFVVDSPGMVGWGRTTRRCRRSRCHPPQSVTTALT